MLFRSRDSFAKGGWQGYQHALVSELEQKKSNPYTLAIAYVELGEKDKAFAALEDVFNAHSNFVGYFKIDPQLKPQAFPSELKHGTRK